MKKKLSVFFTVAVILVMGITTVSATTPRWINTSIIIPTITASDGSFACAVTGQGGTNRIDISMVLYEKEFWGNYKQVGSKSGSYNGQAYTCVGYADIKPGKTYRLDFTTTVIRNETSEILTNSFENKC